MIDEFLAALAPGEAERLVHARPLWARAAQLPPPGRWRVWLLMAGRGFGKTRAGASWLQRNWRPLTMLSFLGLVIADAFGMLAFRLADQAWLLLQIGLGGYVVGRSVEKISPQIANGHLNGGHLNAGHDGGATTSVKAKVTGNRAAGKPAARGTATRTKATRTKAARHAGK